MGWEFMRIGVARGEPVSISALMVLPSSHRTISDLWITFLCMRMLFRETKSVELRSQTRMNSDIKDESPCWIGFNWRLSLKSEVEADVKIRN